MPTDVKRDQARTRLARRAVVDAARTLFLARGYQATTVEAISTAADVPAATVYRLFSAKLGILKALLDISIAGDDQPVAMPERPQVVALDAQGDPAQLLADLAAITVGINTRSGDVYRILTSAAGADPAAAELLDDYQRQRAQGQGGVARRLARSGALRAGLRRARRRRPDPCADVAGAVPAPGRRSTLVGEALRALARRHTRRSIARSTMSQSRVRSKARVRAASSGFGART